MRTSAISLVLAVPFLLAAYSAATSSMSHPASDVVDEALALELWQVIGEGTDFLVVQVESPLPFLSIENLSASAIDADGFPLRRVTSFAADDPQNNDHAAWLFFILYDPSHSPAHSLKSQRLRFTRALNGKRIEKNVSYVKTWGGDGDARIFDGPLPPDPITGHLVLCDGVFLADGDPRLPEGPHISARLIGANGRWSRIEALSDVLDFEPQSELRLEVDRGWLELSTGRSHSMPEAVAPVRPYVEGWWDGKGCFHPDSPRVQWFN